MRWLIALLLVASLSVGLALAMRYNAGYVLFMVPPYRVELSVSLFVIVVAIVIGFAYFSLRVVFRAIQLPERARQFRQGRRRAQARAAMLDGLRAMFEGRYAHAVKAAGKAANLGEAPVLNALIAARSAHRLREFELRDEWLKRAEEGGDDYARVIAEAEMLLDQQRVSDALGLLAPLRLRGARHIAGLRLLLRAHQAARNWDQVLDLVGQLEKRSALPGVQASELRIRAHAENLRRASFDVKSLNSYWDRIPAGLRVEPSLAVEGARLLIGLADAQRARQVLESSLAHQWSSECVRLYGNCALPDGRAQIECAERWLKDNPRDADLLLALGRLCLRAGLWGKAQSYLEASLSIQAGRPAHVELAQLFERLGRLDEAGRHFRDGAVLELSS